MQVRLVVSLDRGTSSYVHVAPSPRIVHATQGSPRPEPGWHLVFRARHDEQASPWRTRIWGRGPVRFLRLRPLASMVYTSSSDRVRKASLACKLVMLSRGNIRVGCGWKDRSD